MTSRASIQLLRLVSATEGLSWLVLIGAMIYRANTGEHEPVAITGRVHGGLFCLFCAALLLAWIKAHWQIPFTFLIGVSSLIPFGFLFADHYLRKKLIRGS